MKKIITFLIILCITLTGTILYISFKDSVIVPKQEVVEEPKKEEPKREEPKKELPKEEIKKEEPSDLNLIITKNTEEKTNEVRLTVYSYGDFDYVLNPDGTQYQMKSYFYIVKKNGTYTFTLVRKNKQELSKSVIITNISEEEKISVSEIKLDKTYLTLKVGESYQFNTSIIPENAINKELKYSSSNTEIAKMEGNKIIAINEGSVLITVTSSNGKTDRCNVVITRNSVTEKKQISSISLNAYNLELNIDEYHIFNPVITPSDAENKDLTYTSSNTNVVSVSGSKITAKSVGTATITAKSSNGKTASTTVVVKKYGLVNNNGNLELNGKKVNMMGVNTFSMFGKVVNGINDDYKNEIDLLAKYNIPFVRLPICTWNSTYLNKYTKDKESYFKKLDNVLNYLEQKKIGAVVVFFWLDESLPYYIGETRSDMGDVNSNTIKLAKEYITDVIKRYKNHKAVWGYEIGNEYNLTVDLYPSNGIGINPTYYQGTKSDAKNYFTTNEMVTFYTEVSKTIRNLDPYRIISTGDAATRAGAYSAYERTKDIYTSNHKKWSPSISSNGKDKIKTMVKKFNPSKINTLSTHLYKYDLSGKIGSFNDYLKFYVDIGNELKMPVFIGEFSGNTKNDGSGYEGADKGYSKSEFDNQVNAIKSNGNIPLSAVWMFNRDTKLDYIISDVQPKDKHRFEKIVEYNKDNKSKIDEYWN